MQSRRVVKVLVSGGTGFIGSHSVRALRAEGHEVRVLARSPEKVKRVFGPLGIDVETSPGDVTDAASVEVALEGCDAVLHAAGLVDMRASQARRMMETNLGGVKTVVGAALDHGIERIVYTSSLSVFFRPGAPPLHPDLPIPDGGTPYARSKAAAERWVRAAQADGAPIQVTYPAGVVGPDDPGLSEGNRAVYTWLHQLSILTKGGFQPVDVRDLAQLHVRLLRDCPGRGNWTAATPMIPWSDLPDLIEELIGRRIRLVRTPAWALVALGHVGDVVKRVVDFDFPLTAEAMQIATGWPGGDASRTREALGVTFRSPESTFRDTIAWLHRAGHLTAAEVGRLAS